MSEVVKGVVTGDDGVEGAAQLVAANLMKEGTPEVKAFDPAMIMLIIQILQLIVENCPLFKRGAQAVKDSAVRPSLLQRWAVQRQVKAAVFSQDGDSGATKEERAIWREHGDALVEAVLKAGVDATPEMIQRLIDEVSP